MPCTPERVWRAIQDARAVHRGDAGRHALTGYGGLDRPEQPRRRGPVIPAPFDYVRPASVEEAVAALAEAGEDAKVLAGGQCLMPVLRLRLAAPSLLVDLGGIAELRGVRDDGDAHRHRRDDARTTTSCATRWSQRARAAAGPGHGDGGRPRRSATAAPSAARSRTPTRPATSARSALALDARVRRSPGRSGTRTVSRGGLLRRLLHHRARPRTRSSPRSGSRSYDRAGAAHYEKFNRVAQAWSIVRGGRGGPASRAARSPRPGSG